jgi:hypothetical protein
LGRDNPHWFKELSLVSTKGHVGCVFKTRTGRFTMFVAITMFAAAAVAFAWIKVRRKRKASGQFAR